MSAETSDGDAGTGVAWRVIDRFSAVTWFRLVAAALGVTSLMAAVLVVTGVGGDRVTTTVTTVVSLSRGVLLVLAVFSGVVAVASLLRGRHETEGRQFVLPPPPEQTVDEDSLVGAEFDRSLDRGVDRAPDVLWWKGVGVKEELRSLAVSVLRDHAGHSLDEAARALETGSWTDDPRAATYLGVEDHRSLRTRIRDWFGGEARTRQVEATLAELASLVGIDVGDADGSGDVEPADLEPAAVESAAVEAADGLERVHATADPDAAVDAIDDDDRDPTASSGSSWDGRGAEVSGR